MKAETRSPAVASYLARLDEASRLLPDDLRAELVGQVREHLAELEHSGLDDVGLRVALERFGTPEQLVAAEAEQAGLVLAPADQVRTTTTAAVDLPAAPERPVWGGLELSAVLLVLLGGFVVPVLAPVVGMVLAWLSPRWTRRTKVGTTLVFCSPVVLVIAGALLYLVTGVWTNRTPQSDDGYWDSAYPVVSHGGEIFTGIFLALLVLSLVGWLVAGLWLALAGREPRRTA